jgi:hypothetical protein
MTSETTAYRVGKRDLTECFATGESDTVKNKVEARKKERKEQTKEESGTGKEGAKDK